MTKGETVRCIIDYNLFECENINGKEGCYVHYSEANDKHLIYFPGCCEWAELVTDDFIRVNSPGYVSQKNKKFIKTISRLKVTLET